MERREFLIHKWMHFFFPVKKGPDKAKLRCSLWTGSSGGIKWCTFVFLGCCQTPWNDRVERNVRFPPFIIMITLKPNYSHLNSSLLAMLLLMAALNCMAWQGARWAAQTSHWSSGRARSSSRPPGPGSLWPACSQALWRTGTLWHPLQGDAWCATQASAWQGPHRAPPLLCLWPSQHLVTAGAASLLQDLPPPLCFVFLSQCTPETRQLCLDLGCLSTLPLPRKTTTGNPSPK